jgi:hypothetical protein
MHDKQHNYVSKCGAFKRRSSYPMTLVSAFNQLCALCIQYYSAAGNFAVSFVSRGVFASMRFY